jgi:hypothetical protein
MTQKKDCIINNQIMKNYPEKYAGVWSRYYILGNFPGKYPENH